MENTVKPYNEGGKKEEVEKMFDNIAHSYDFLNHFFSLGIDILWRKKAIRILKKENPKRVLDVATGTADFAMEAVRMNLGATEIIGVDISEGMLEVGRKKIKEKGYDKIITLKRGDSENLPFEDNSFDAVTVGFGIRNFETLNKGLAEILRVLRPGGIFVILETSVPEKAPFKQGYSFYTRKILPMIGKLFSSDNAA